MNKLLEKDNPRVDEKYEEKVTKKKRITNEYIDEQERQLDHFSKGINIYKLLLICYVGSFVGVIIEMIWWYLKTNRIESRAGLVYGPFNLLYGAGTVIMTVCLYVYRNKAWWKSLLWGTFIGTVFEYLCAVFQEHFLGTQSWDYSRKPLNIDGKVCLLYSVFWGILGLVWIKVVYPRLSAMFLKIPKKKGKIITWIVCIFFIFNIIVTMISTYRWTRRNEGEKADGVFWEFVDERFTDERMKKIFPNMKPVKK